MADRDIAERLFVGAPNLVDAVHVYRAFLGRVVRYLVGVGVRQFLDLGSGLPTADNVHEVAQDLHSDCRVVYVDIDPGVVAKSRNLLAGNHGAAIVRADLRQPQQVFEAIRQCGLLDLGAPLAMLVIDVLHHIPDVDNPSEIIAGYLDEVCPGSYISVAHSGHDEALVSGLKDFGEFYQISIPLLTFRHLTQIAGFFGGLDLVAPGIVPVPLWRPELGESMSTDPEGFPAYCGLGLKTDWLRSSGGQWK